jgi:hypothetical protein
VPLLVLLTGGRAIILGLKLDDDIFGKATAKLGKGHIVKRGDGSAGRSQLCYSSPDKRSRIYLVFEKGEMNDAFYMFSDGPNWKGRDFCAESSLITTDISTVSGLRLGQTAAQITRKLGKPSVIADDKVIYSLSVQKKTSASDFENLKRQNPTLSEKELHENFDLYTLGVFIELRFSGGGLVYLAVSKIESY